MGKKGGGEVEWENWWGREERQCETNEKEEGKEMKMTRESMTNKWGAMDKVNMK